MRVDDEQIRAEAQGLSRAVGARGQMTMQEMLVNRGADLPEPELRTSMITLAGTEPSTLFGMSRGARCRLAGRQDAAAADGHPDGRSCPIRPARWSTIPTCCSSMQTTDGIADKVIADATASVTNVGAGPGHRARATPRSATAVVVLAAIVVALVIVLLVARALVGRCACCATARSRSPTTTSRARSTGSAPVAEPIPQPLPVYTTEEIGQVAHAVDELHEQAVLLAGEQARLQLQVSDMFETMSRRSRSLVDQQLALIDRLERNEEDPERLDSLFRLDHLAARMRRNGANLLVLAGAQVPREQGEPVPLATVINAAASEVEDYRRVESPRPCPTARWSARSAGDLVHLLAELIDNALRYSPPTYTGARVGGAHRQRRGVIEVTDTGLGMTEADLRMANTRLQSGGEVTPLTPPATWVCSWSAGWPRSTGCWCGCAARCRRSGIGHHRRGLSPPTVLVACVRGRRARTRRRRRSHTSPHAMRRADRGAARHWTAATPTRRRGRRCDRTSTATVLRRSRCRCCRAAAPGASGISEIPGSRRSRRPKPSRPTQQASAADAVVGERSQQQPDRAAAPPTTAPAKTASDTSAFFARAPRPSADADPPPKPAAVSPSRRDRRPTSGPG